MVYKYLPPAEEISFCNVTIAREEVLVEPDAVDRADLRQMPILVTP